LQAIAGDNREAWPKAGNSVAGQEIAALAMATAEIAALRLQGLFAATAAHMGRVFPIRGQKD